MQSKRNENIRKTRKIMLFKLLTTLFITTSSFFNFVSADMQYEIQDIGTLQTRSSQAIAINNNGQILGWYNIDGTEKGKHLFVRDRDGSFHEIFEDPSIVYENVPQQQQSIKIAWRFLNDHGKAYGTLILPNDNPILFMWDQPNGLVRLGKMPGKEIMAINNAGQVLIKAVEDYENGKLFKRPAIWKNGEITKLKGLEGNVGIESEESYGLDMNNNGDVVGSCVVFISYKNDLYKQTHAVKWVNGQPIDLYMTIPKTATSSAIAINDIGDVLINNPNTGNYIINKNGERSNNAFSRIYNKLSNQGYVYTIDNSDFILARNGHHILYTGELTQKLWSDYESIWLKITKFIKINDSAEVIAEGETLYGENHAVLLTPVASN